jgi:hypothetical protein
MSSEVVSFKSPGSWRPLKIHEDNIFRRSRHFNGVQDKGSAAGSIASGFLDLLLLAVVLRPSVQMLVLMRGYIGVISLF